MQQHHHYQSLGTTENLHHDMESNIDTNANPNANFNPNFNQNISNKKNIIDIMVPNLQNEKFDLLINNSLYTLKLVLGMSLSWLYLLILVNAVDFINIYTLTIFILGILNFISFICCVKFRKIFRDLKMHVENINKDEFNNISTNKLLINIIKFWCSFLTMQFLQFLKNIISFQMITMILMCELINVIGNNAKTFHMILSLCLYCFQIFYLDQVNFFEMYE